VDEKSRLRLIYLPVFLVVMILKFEVMPTLEQSKKNKLQIDSNQLKIALNKSKNQEGFYSKYDFQYTKKELNSNKLLRNSSLKLEIDDARLVISFGNKKLDMIMDGLLIVSKKSRLVIERLELFNLKDGYEVILVLVSNDGGDDHI
jgi:hypothetical protein